MKKLFILICLLTVFAIPAYSKTLKMTVVTQKDFNPRLNEKVDLKIEGNYLFNDNKYVYSGTIIKGYVDSVVDPKIGKRDGYVYVRVTDIIEHNGKTFKVDNPNAVIKLSKYKPIDIKEKSIDMGVSAAGFVVKNISYPINFVRGAVKAEDGENRIASGVGEAFDKSVFSYVKTGNELSVPTGSKLTVTIKFKNPKGEPDEDTNENNNAED